jgi:hypothetical protein
VRPLACTHPPARAEPALTRARAADYVFPDANRDNRLQDAGIFRIDGWIVAPGLPEDALNGAEPVRALALHHIFPGALPRGRALGLATLLHDERAAAGRPMPPELLTDAFYDFRSTTSSAALRNAHYATRVAVDGAALTAAEVAALGPAAREAIQRGRRAQLLHALATCVERRWSGGVLMLQRFFDAASYGSELRDALAALSHALRQARDGADATPDAPHEPPPPMPPLPESTCGFCHEVMGAARRSMCSRCRAVHYCDATCQAAHWPEHKRGAWAARSAGGGISLLTRAAALMLARRAPQCASRRKRSRSTSVSRWRARRTAAELRRAACSSERANAKQRTQV